MAQSLTIGMSVPGATSGFSPAGLTLGLGDQENDEERKKRLAALASSQQRLSGSLGAYGALSPAGMSLGLGQ